MCRPVACLVFVNEESCEDLLLVVTWFLLGDQSCRDQFLVVSRYSMLVVVLMFFMFNISNICCHNKKCVVIIIKLCFLYGLDVFWVVFSSNHFQNGVENGFEYHKTVFRGVLETGVFSNRLFCNG